MLTDYQWLLVEWHMWAWLQGRKEYFAREIDLIINGVVCEEKR